MNKCNTCRYFEEYKEEVKNRKIGDVYGNCLVIKIINKMFPENVDKEWEYDLICRHTGALMCKVNGYNLYDFNKKGLVCRAYEVKQ